MKDDDKPRISTGFWGTSFYPRHRTTSRGGWCHQRTAPGGCWGCHVRDTWWFRIAMEATRPHLVRCLMISFSMIFQNYAYQRLWIFRFFWIWSGGILRYGDGSKPMVFHRGWRTIYYQHLPAMAWGWVLAMDSWRKMMHQWHQWRWDTQCAELALVWYNNAAVSSIRCRTLGSHFLKDI